MNNILVLGNGWIGNRIKNELGYALSDKRIDSIDDALAEIARLKPQVVINCIGFTGRNVDDCEAQKDKALSANTMVPLILAEACLRSNVKLVHISSGCIYHYDYGQDSPLGEQAAPDFLELYYSRTKIYSEAALGALLRRWPFLLVRIRIPLDDRPDRKNLLTKLIQYKKAIDLPNSVTYIPDFLRALEHLIKIGASGIYNVVNSSPLTYRRLLDEYKKYVPDFKYEVVAFSKLNLVRTNLVLSTKKLEATGFKVRAIEEVLEECVRNYVK